MQDDDLDGKPSPKLIYVARSEVEDPDDLIQAFSEWMSFLEDDAAYPTDQVSQDARALDGAARYFAGIENNFHAVHFHNKLRNGEFDEHVRLARIGLGRLGDPTFSEVLDDAVKLYEANRSAWENWPSLNSDEKNRAQGIMASADQRFCMLATDRRMWNMLADAIRALPDLRIVADRAIESAREQLLAASPAQQQKAERLERRAEEREVEARRASEVRDRKALQDPESFAANWLAKAAGYTDVFSIGDKEVLEDGVSTRSAVSLRKQDGQPQMNWLVDYQDQFALFNWPFEDVLAKATAADLERERRARLGLPPEPAKSSFGFPRLFGRKK